MIDDLLRSLPQVAICGAAFLVSCQTSVSGVQQNEILCVVVGQLTNSTYQLYHIGFKSL